MHTGIVQVGTFCEWSSAISSSPAPTGHIVKYAAQNVAMNQINTRPPAIQRKSSLPRYGAVKAVYRFP